MIIVIQCAAKKQSDAGCLRTHDGKQTFFVADPRTAPERPDYSYARPGDLSDMGVSWRELLLGYNESPGTNPLNLYRAFELYQNPTYQLLVDRFGLDKVFILSAGWGLIKASFLTPDYDITFSASAEAYKRRKKSDIYHDFCQLPENADEELYFFGGKDYVPLFCKLTRSYRGKRTIFYNSTQQPEAPGCSLRRFETRTRTNWHYECAQDFASGDFRSELYPRVPHLKGDTQGTQIVKDNALGVFDKSPDLPEIKTPGLKGGKYEPLQVYLSNLPKDKTNVSLSFTKIEQILGASLPRSAYTHRPWWANQSDSKNRPQAHAWLSAGFNVAGVQQRSDGGAVEFHRKGF